MTASRFAIVVSRFNEEVTTGLLTGARALLAENGVAPADVTVVEVPGAFEIPLAVQRVASSRKDIDAIIALGVIIEGDTEHASLIATTVTDALQQIALANDLPVIHEVLFVRNAEQARQRCLEDAINRGTEAARVAVRMLQVLQEIGATKR